MKKLLLLVFFGITAIILYENAKVAFCSEDDLSIKMSTTTSTENSGLLDFILPRFKKRTGIWVKVSAKGTGAALRDGMEGNVDVILVHAKKREEEFVSKGYGAYRLQVMHNDFIIVGPKSDPAGIRGLKDPVLAFKKIAMKKAKFVSRGDDSGTHIKEQKLWHLTGIKLKKRVIKIIRGGKEKQLLFEYPLHIGKWYLSIGQGMGKTLTYADEKQAYTLTDRGTFLKYKYGTPLGIDLEIMCEGSPILYNPYGVIPINPERFPHVRFKLADRFARWLVSHEAQSLIRSYRIYGKQLFFPDALPLKKE